MWRPVVSRKQKIEYVRILQTNSDYSDFSVRWLNELIDNDRYGYEFWLYSKGDNRIVFGLRSFPDPKAVNFETIGFDYFKAAPIIFKFARERFKELGFDYFRTNKVPLDQVVRRFALHLVFERPQDEDLRFRYYENEYRSRRSRNSR